MTAAPPTDPPVAKRRNLNRGKVGMACMICSEVTFFGTLLATYLFYIGRDVSGPYPQDVLDVSVAPMKVVFNSIFLLTSSIWIVLAIKALRSLNWVYESCFERKPMKRQPLHLQKQHNNGKSYKYPTEQM